MESFAAELMAFYESDCQARTSCWLIAFAVSRRQAAPMCDWRVRLSAATVVA